MVDRPRRGRLSYAGLVFGGFSTGSAMSYALGLGGDRPVPAALLIFSGFILTIEGWQPVGERLGGTTGEYRAGTSGGW